MPPAARERPRGAGRYETNGIVYTSPVLLHVWWRAFRVEDIARRVREAVDAWLAAPRNECTTEHTTLHDVLRTTSPRPAFYPTVLAALRRGAPTHPTRDREGLIRMFAEIVAGHEAREEESPCRAESVRWRRKNVYRVSKVEWKEW